MILASPNTNKSQVLFSVHKANLCGCCSAEKDKTCPPSPAPTLKGAISSAPGKRVFYLKEGFVAGETRLTPGTTSAGCRAAAVTRGSGSWMNCRHRAGTVTLAGDTVPSRVHHTLCHFADGPGCWRDRGEGNIQKHPENSEGTSERQRSAAPVMSLHPGDECTNQAALNGNRGRELEIST